MAGKAVSGLALGFMTVGGVLIWSGIKGQTIGTTVKGLARGQVPQGEDPAYAAATSQQTAGGTTPSRTTVPVTATGSSIANDALKYVGHAYVYGGAPGASGKGGWDCSSFVSWVLGHDLGMTIPGSSSPGYNGASHGPNVASYALWSHAQTISRANVQAGDLIIWPPNQHIGIATSHTEFVSALNEQLGTLNIPIASNGGGWIARRIVLGSSHG